MTGSDRLIVLAAAAVFASLGIVAILSKIDHAVKFLWRYAGARLSPIVVTEEGLRSPAQLSPEAQIARSEALKAYRELNDCCERLPKIPHHKPEGFSPIELAIAMAGMCKFHIRYVNSRADSGRLHSVVYWREVERTARSGLAMADASSRKGVEIVEAGDVAGPRIIE